MKTKLLFLLLTVICAYFPSFGQENALAKVHYTFIHVNDTTQPDKKHQSEMVLYLGQHSSYYLSYAGKRMQEQVKKQMDDVAFDGNLTIKGAGSNTPESYYMQTSERLLKKGYQLLQQSYVLDQEFPEMEWVVQDESREIGGYRCQKAETDFKGRHYTAWFTTEIPFQAGPWKLHGLPGLILEASDQKNEVRFLYAGFEKMEELDIPVGLPENSIETNEKSLNNLVTAYRKNPSAAAKAAADSGGSSSGSGSPFDGFDASRIKSINVMKSDVLTSPVNNNPIELAD